MAFRIDFDRDVHAPPSLVWGVVSDLAAYPQWNPFVIACRSTLEPGEPIRMRVQLLPWIAQEQAETVFEHLPGTRLCYGLAGDVTGAIRSRRCHELEPLDGGRTRYRSRFELSGWMAPLVRMLLGRRLESGFRAMTDALVARAEASAKKTS